MTRAVWSELVEYRELKSSRVLSLLASRGVQLFVAVTPPDVDELSAVVLAARDAGVAVSVWPMLSHADGRWPNADNVTLFRLHVEHVLKRLDEAGAVPDGLAVDLEPNIGDLERLLALDAKAIRQQLLRRGPRRAQRAYASLVETLRGRGIPTLAATIPLILSDDGRLDGWQRFFGTPCTGVGFDRVSPMLYTSMFEGYARGGLSRRDTLSLLASGARRTSELYGARASASLGAVGHGIFGHEPMYRSVAELAEDVAIARAAGIEHLVAFSLGGMLRRGPAEAWLDALVDTEPASELPPLTPRARTIAIGMSAASHALHWGARLWRAAALSAGSAG